MTRNICIAGKNRVAIETLKLFTEQTNLKIYSCPVLSDLGEDDWQPSFKKFSMLNRIEMLKLDEVKQLKEVVFLSMEYDRLINPIDLASAKLLNVHFSLLPAYKGCYTSVWPLYFGESRTGVTLHEIDAGIDTGSIIDQLEIPLNDRINATQLYETYQDAAVALVEKNLKGIVSASYRASPQPPGGSSYFSRASLKRINLELDFWATASQVNNKVRALYFPEYQTATYNGLGVASCEITNTRSTLKPGSVVQDLGTTTVIIATVDFDVKLTRVGHD